MSTQNIIFIVVFIIVIFTIAIISEIYRTRCPKCRKFWARKIYRTTDSYETHRMLRENQHTHVHSISYCICKFCGHQWKQKYTTTKDKDEDVNS